MGRPDHHQTSAADVCRVLDLLNDGGVEPWVSGGWGVDALVGRQTRLHRDVDLLIPLRQSLRASEKSWSVGFRLETDWFPTRFEVIDHHGVVVDVHPIRALLTERFGVEVPMSYR